MISGERAIYSSNSCHIDDRDSLETNAYLRTPDAPDVGMLLWRDIRNIEVDSHGAITMTNLSPQTDETLCHLHKASYVESRGNSIELELPDELSPLETQVAGHSLDNVKNSIGMLRAPAGRVLKPIYKPHLGEREIAFYENLQRPEDATIARMRHYIPRYFGTTELKLYDKRVKFIVLENITDGMAEPCVMDVKIGKRTWDPLASERKRAAEERKYVESKRIYGLSITGFQVYSLPSGERKRFDKNYGKTLTAEGVVEALKIFLNVSTQIPACRQLIVKLLSYLWKILLVFREQKRFRFYSSSILMAYDARRLRHYLKLNAHEATDDCTFTCQRMRSLSSSKALTNASKGSIEPPSTVKNKALEKARKMKRSFSVSCDKEISSDKVKGQEERKLLQRSESCGADDVVDRLCRTHSFTNNFDHEIVKMKEEYVALLSELNAPADEKENWVRVNMIDFTHVFPAENESTVDINYLHGIENLIKLVEMFLSTNDERTSTRR